MFEHITVLKGEVVEALRVGRGGLFVDGTVGGGGHSEAILLAGEAAGVEVRLLGLDRDPEALEAARVRLAPHGSRVELVQGNYRDLPVILSERGLGAAAGLVVDAGVSSPQLDVARRGFSFSQEGPLDMRMGPDAQTAAEIIDASDERQLAAILGRYGEVKGAMRVASRIKAAREAGRLETTSQLAALCGTRRRGERIHPATQVFQALRIAANDELGGLEALVLSIPEVVAAGGRAAIISFHSLEDRIVKQGVRWLSDPCSCPPGLPMCVCGAVAKVKSIGKLVRSTEAEVQQNPRSRSARLRVAEVL